MSAASSHAVTASIRSLSEGLFHIEHQPFEILPFGVIDVDRVVGRLRELVQWWMETTEIWMDAWSGEREFVVNEEDDGADADAPGEEDA